MTVRTTSRTRVLLALAVVATGVGAVAPGASAADPKYTGFNSATVATPVRVEIFDPTIPLPAEPQAELNLGYSTVNAATGDTKSRASLLWPGATLGEGFKVVADTIGLPKEIGEAGYPVQANAAFPGGPKEQVSQPFPGGVQRTEATAEGASSSVGVAGDCDVRPGKTSDCPVPAALAAVADVTGSSASSDVVNKGGKVVATARAEAEGVSLLGGLLVFGSVSAETTGTTDGVKPTGTGEGTYSGFTLAGQQVRTGSDGTVVAGQELDVPGLPSEPVAALKALGLTVSLPEPTATREGSALLTTASSAVVEVDTAVLRSKLDGLPLQDVVGSLPDEAGPVRDLLITALAVAPRYVITLAATSTSVNTSQGIVVPPLPAVVPPVVPSAGPAPVAPGTTTGTAPTTDLAAPELAVDPGAAPLDMPDATVTEDPATGLQVLSASGARDLPALPALPAFLVLLAGVVAAGAGKGLQGLSAFVLGGGHTLCAHGLDSGIPDLRKA